MTLNYQKVWESMNSLETVMCKAVSVRQVIDAAAEALESGNRDKAENLINVAYDFIGYFIDEFDENFKTAWHETVVKLKQSQFVSTCDSNNNSSECKSAWTSFWEENYYPEEYEGESNTESKDKVVKWRLPVEMDGPSGEYFISFPDDLLEAAGLEEGDEVYWVDNEDGTFTLRKTTRPLRMDEC